MESIRHWQMALDTHVAMTTAVSSTESTAALVSSHLQNPRPTMICFKSLCLPRSWKKKIRRGVDRTLTQHTLKPLASQPRHNDTSSLFLGARVPAQPSVYESCRSLSFDVYSLITPTHMYVFPFTLSLCINNK